MTTRDYRGWLSAAGVASLLAAVVAGCGGTGGGSGNNGNPQDQFVLNSSNSGRLILNVDPNEVNANKSDRIGLVAQLTDNLGNPIKGSTITFSSDIDDITFIPALPTADGTNLGLATTDANGNADIIAVAGSQPTSTGAIIGTGAIFAEAPRGFSLRAQSQVTLLDVGFIDADVFSVIPSSAALVEPAPGAVVFFNLVGGTPPYMLVNESSGIGTAVIGDHCLPGCTKNGGVLCVGSPCQSDSECNLDGSPVPSGVCVGTISHCLASCAGADCAGSRCSTDADCNDGSPTPANVCEDSGQSIAYIISTSGTDGTHTFIAEDSTGAAVTVTVTVSFICGNGVARGNEQCDLGDLKGATCQSLGFTGGGTLLCDDACKFDTSNCVVASPGGGGGGTPGGPTPTGVTPTPTGVTPTPTPGGATPTVVGTPGPGVPSNLTLALLANGSGDNGNGTLTTVIAATVTDSLGNPVPNGTLVSFNIDGSTCGGAMTTCGAVINSPSGTNANPPCDVSNFENDTGVTVLNQPGVAHTCVTYPSSAALNSIDITAVAGAGTDSQTFLLPAPPP